MSNNYFKFKQFTIHQDACAMKVSTDACLFGAWCASKISHYPIKNIIDIGTGTGLLSLMIAQQNNANIHAVEIDVNAYHQAKDNINKSAFKDKISVHHSAIQNYNSNQLYDFIITNPPFYENSLKSNYCNRNTALHSTDLDFLELISCIKKLLSPIGLFALLLPYNRTEYFENIASNYFLLNKIVVKHSHQHSAFRTILLYSNINHYPTYTENICIKEIDNVTYTPLFTSLLKSYYLFL